MLLLITQRFSESNSGAPETTLDSSDVIPLQKAGDGRDGHILYSVLQGLIGAGYLDKVTYDPDGDGIVNGAHYLSYQGHTYVVQDSSKVKISEKATGGGYVEIKDGTVYIYTDTGGVAGTIASLAYVNGSQVMCLDAMGAYLKTDGSDPLADNYSPVNGQDIATRAYVDNKALGLSTTYVVVNTTALYNIPDILVGDRGIVTSDGTPSDNGEYICNTANTTAPSNTTMWTKVESSGDLLSSGLVPMVGTYEPSDDQDIATKKTVDDAVTALTTASIDPLKTTYQHYTWAIPSILESGQTLTPMVVMPPTGETWYLSRLALVASDDFDIDMQEDGSDISGWVQLSGTDVLSIVNGTDVELTSSSLLAPKVVHQVAGGLTDVTVTVEIKKVRS